jgi:hypothetical protein
LVEFIELIFQTCHVIFLSIRITLQKFNEPWNICNLFFMHLNFRIYILQFFRVFLLFYARLADSFKLYFKKSHIWVKVFLSFQVCSWELVRVFTCVALRLI